MQCSRIGVLLLVLSLIVGPADAGTEAARPDKAPRPRIIHDEHTVYIPYEEIERVFEKEGRGVFLPYAEFIKLWEKARPAKRPKPTPRPPFDAAISAGTYEGVISGDAAILTATYTIEMLKDDGWAALSLPLSGSAVTESQIEGDKAILNVTDEGYSLLMGAPGVYKLILKFVTRVKREPGKNVFSFGCPRCAVSRLQMTLPGKDVAVNVEPLLVASTAPAEGGGTMVQAFLGATDEVTFQWWPKTIEKAREDALLFVKTYVRTHVSEGSLRTDATLAYDILRAPSDQFKIDVPGDVRVVSVDGANLKDWNVDTDQGQQLVTALLHAPAKNHYELKLSLERAIEEFPASLSLPEIVPVNAARESGCLALTKDEYLSLKITERAGISQMAAEDLPAPLKGQNVFFAGSYVSHPLQLVLAADRIEPKVTADVSSVITVLRENVRLISQLRYRIRKAGIFKTRFRLPRDTEIREVGDETSVEDFTVEEEGEVRTVTVHLAKRAFGDFVLPITCEQTRQSNVGALSLPVPAILDVERQKGAITVAVHETLEAKVTASQNVTPMALREMTKQKGKVKAARDVRTVFGFQYLRQPLSVILEVEKREPQVTARVDSHIQVAEDAVKLKTTIFYSIKYAGITELAFLVPARLGDELRITGANIKEKVRSPVEAADASVPKQDRWRVTLQGETLGEYQLRLEYETKLEGVRKGEATGFDVPEIAVADVARENGFFAVSKGPNVEVDAETNGLEEIDTRELASTSLVAPGTFLAFKYLYHPYELKLKMTLHEYVGVLQTLVSQAHLESVFSKDGVIMTDAKYLVQNNQLPLLPMALPGDSTVRSLFVNGLAERPRKGEKDQLLIPVAKAPPGRVFEVRLVYETRHRDDSMGCCGSLETSAPVFPKAIPVLRLIWDVYVPKDYKYLWAGGNMLSAERRVRGWGRIKQTVGYVTPRLAPRIEPVFTDPQPGGPAPFHPQPPGQMPQQQGIPTPQAAAPARPSFAAAIAVEFPREGIRHQFTKLSGDGTFYMPYLKERVYTAVDVLLFLLTLVIGVRWARTRSKVRFVVGAVAGAILIASFCPATIAGWVDSVFWGALVLGVVWISPSCYRKLREMHQRRRARKAEEKKPVDETGGRGDSSDRKRKKVHQRRKARKPEEKKPVDETGGRGDSSAPDEAKDEDKAEEAGPSEQESNGETASPDESGNGERES